MMTEFHSPVQTHSEMLGMKTIWRATEQLLYFLSLLPWSVIYVREVLASRETVQMQSNAPFSTFAISFWSNTYLKAW